MSKDKRTFARIAKDIKSIWLNPYFGAMLYLDALLSMDTSISTATYKGIKVEYIVKWFLESAKTLRGKRAEALKKELIELLQE